MLSFLPVREKWPQALERVLSLDGMTHPYIVRAALLPTAGLLALFMAAWIRMGDVYLPTHLAPFLPLPAAFLLWATQVDRQARTIRPPSLFWLCLSMMSFIVAAGLVRSVHADLRGILIALGMICGMLASMPARQWLSHSRSNRQVTGIALFAALCVLLYYMVSIRLWRTVCEITGRVLFTLLYEIDRSIWMTMPRPNMDLMIHSDHFVLRIFLACSGLEGIFLFFFLLSAMLLVDWPLFARRRWWLLYPFGVFYMFVFNVLRLASLFWLGNWAWKPDAGPFQQSFRGATLDMFHSYVGWAYYLFAFGLFTAVLYPRITRQRTNP